MPEMAQRESLISSVRAAETHPDPHQAGAIPPWVHANDGEDEQDQLLTSPTHARPNTRHYKPPTHYKPGRKWDHYRSAEPALLSAPIAEHQERWKAFMKAGPNPHEPEGRVVDAAWMEENMPHMNPNFNLDEDDAASHGITAKGLMYKGMWLISPERQEKTVRLFWVSWYRLFHFVCFLRSRCEGVAFLAFGRASTAPTIFVLLKTGTCAPHRRHTAYSMQHAGL